MKVKTTLTLFILAVTSLHLSVAGAAPYNTANYYQCYNKIGGSWNFGRVPNACDVDPWGSPEYVKDKFAAVIFNDNVPTTAERKRYMNELHAMLRDATAYYIRQRKPGVSQAEIAGWQRANFAKAHQETFWTHYREAKDGNIKMIRGDYGHGHGLVQIDDRWHFTKIQEGKGWNIFENITYGMEIFYDEWQRAASASCVSSPSNWRSRARAAYAAYNGGPRKLCRWTNPNDVWARNDKGYRDKYDAQTWAGYISDLNYQTEIDVPCFMEGSSACGVVGLVDENDPANWEGHTIALASGESCIFTNNTFECVKDAKDSMCLTLQFGSSEGVLSPDVRVTAEYTKTIHEKHACYADAVEGLATVGKSIETLLSVTMRATAGGNAIGVASQANKVYQVLDYVVNDESNQYRYYRIKEGDKEGYIYAGNATNHTDWSILVDHSALVEGDIIIPQAGDTLKIVSATGINMRAVPGGTLLGAVAVDATLVVEDIVIQGVDNNVYYQVTDKGITGYLYGGKILSGNTLADWAIYSEPVPVVTYPEVGSAIQITNATGINLRTKPGGAVLTNLPVGTAAYVFEIITRGTNDYRYYKITYEGQTGYIYGGQAIAADNTLDNWAMISEVVKLANAGQVVSNASNSNQRATPGGALQQTIPAGQRLTVISRIVQGDNNYVYYKVNYNGRAGYIYSGYISPSSTVASWITIED